MSVPTAQVFYGSSSSTQTPPASKPAVDAAAAATLAAAAKGNEEAKPEPKSTKDVLYGDPATIARDFERTIGSEVDRIAADMSMSPEERAEFVTETGQIFNGLGVGASEAAPFMSLYTQFLLKPPDEQTDTQWRREGLAAVNAKYGHADAHRRIERVKEFLALPENETLRNELNATRLGNHPKVLEAFCERADKLIPKK
jgi:hypothetical protein